MKRFSFRERSENLNTLATEDFDLVVIGGGINGAGVARDAALRGMKTALIEGKDFASGTSSRSSKLIHGGIRYLENLEFHLVFEALSERAKLFTLAPHLVHPLRFQIPLYEHGRVGMLKMGLGMWLYDALSLFDAPEMHERLNRTESLKRTPILQEEKLLGSYVYSDAYMDDDRLVHETLRSANDHGAVICNYVRAMGVEFDKSKQVKTVLVRDELSNKEIAIKGRHFVSTVGPWSDELGHEFFKDWKDQLRTTKGVHLTFLKNRLPLQNAVVMAAEKRIVFAIPRHEMVIIGTTDTDYTAAPEKVVTEAEDVKYLLRVTDQYFPGAKIQASDIVGAYAGVRPLVDDGSESEGKTSREHVIMTEPHGVTFVMGGKYTTYRLVAKQAVEHCLSYFPIEDRVRFGRCRSQEPINPLVTEESFADLNNIHQQLALRTSFTATEIQWLADRHGPEALQIIENCGDHLSYAESEARHAIESTMCMNLLDFFTRRVPFILARVDHGAKYIESVQKIFAEAFGLSQAEITEQRNALKAHVQHEFAWRQFFK